MEFFYSPQIERTAPQQMTNSSPVNLGVAKAVPTVQHVSADRALFYDGDALKPEVYFRRYATLPFPLACSPDFLGILVLTSDQDNPFAEDVLETMRFMSSLVANYVTSYNRCAMAYEQDVARRETVKPDRSVVRN
jgi:hypothetical protein